MTLVKPATALHNRIKVASIVQLLSIVKPLSRLLPLTHSLLEPLPGILGLSIHLVLPPMHCIAGSSHGPFCPRFRPFPKQFQLGVRVPCPLTE